MADDEKKEGYISMEQAARLLMLGAERVRQLIKDGWVERGPRGQVLLVSAVQGYIRFRDDADRRAQRSAADSRVRDARAREIELRISVKEGSTIPLTDAMAALDIIVGGIRSEFEGLAASVTRDREMRHRIEDRVNGALARSAQRLEQFKGNAE